MNGFYIFAQDSDEKVKQTLEVVRDALDSLKRGSLSKISYCNFQ